MGKINEKIQKKKTNHHIDLNFSPNIHIIIYYIRPDNNIFKLVWFFLRHLY